MPLSIMSTRARRPSAAGTIGRCCCRDGVAEPPAWSRGSFFLQDCMSGPVLGERLLGQLGDAVEVKAGGPVIRAQGEHLAEAQGGQLEIAVFEIIQRLGEGLAPGGSGLGLLRAANQLVHRDEALEAFELKAADGPG